MTKIRPTAAQIGSDCRGAFAVEFALVIPVLLILIFGILEFSRYYQSAQQLQTLVFESNRLALKNQDASASVIKTGIEAFAPSDVTVTVTETSIAGQNLFTIELQRNFNFVVPFFTRSGLTQSVSSQAIRGS